MDIHVDLVPDLRAASRARPDDADASIVIDVLRSATVTALLFERGARSVTLTSGLRAARSLAQASSALLIGERGGFPPEGFNHGGSPSALRSIRIDDRDVVLLATESPAALAAARGTTWLAGLTNAVAVVDAVVARSPASVRVICAGDTGAPDLSDTIAAGLLIAMLDRAIRETHGTDVTLTGAATFCLGVLRTTKDPLDGIWASSFGAVLRSVGLEEDLAIASAVASSAVAPRVVSLEEMHGKPVARVVQHAS